MSREQKSSHHRTPRHAAADAESTGTESPVVNPLHELPPGAGFRSEPEMDVEIVLPCVVYGEDAAPGDVLTVYGNEGNILIGAGQAKLATPPPPPPPTT